MRSRAEGRKERETTMQNIRKLSRSSLVPHSGQYVIVHVLHCSSYIMKRKPCLHAGIVTTDPNKKEFLIAVCEAPDDRLTRIQEVPENTAITQKNNAICAFM